MKRILRYSVALLAINCCLTGYAQIPPVYHQVAATKQIPVDILYAIAATESLYGYTNPVSQLTVYHPWPWSLNINRKSFRFNSRVEAYRALIEAIEQGHSVDVGLMQINWRWHRQRFDNAWAMLDPYKNLIAGADILWEQYQHSGDWWQAIGAYHAPGRDKASRLRAEQYRQRVKQHRLSVIGTQD